MVTVTLPFGPVVVGAGVGVHPCWFEDPCGTCGPADARSAIRPNARTTANAMSAAHTDAVHGFIGRRRI